MTKTEFCDRIKNPNPRVRIYDLDGTVVDSSHRARHDENGKLDLEHWKANSTKENIFNDSLLPLVWQLINDYKNGDIIVICTARELGKYDWEYLHTMGIYYDYVFYRPLGKNTPDHVLKRNQLRHFWNLKQYKNLEKEFYDDNQDNLNEIEKLGARVINAKRVNLAYGG